MSSQQPRRKMLLEVMRERIRLRHLSRYTEKQYIGWARRYIRFHAPRHPREVGAQGISEFLSYLTLKLNLSTASQNQALNALVFLYRNVLQIELGELKGISWAKTKRNVPVVLTRREMAAILHALRCSPMKWLIASLLYGSGMRLIECLRLRVLDIDFVRFTIKVHDGKGSKDRMEVAVRIPIL